MKVGTVGIYVRTTILTPKYDGYESELLAFCEQQGWDNVQIYRDRVGGKIAHAGLDALESDLKRGKLDEDLLARLFRQQEDDELHNRDGFRQMLSDAAAGKIDKIIIHDAGQLGAKKMEAFQALEAITRTGKKVVILGVGEVRNDTPIFGPGPIDSPDTFGKS